MHDETAIFCHIPKTAGTTLRRIIEWQYRPKTRHHIRQHDAGVEAFKALPTARRAALRMVYGHIPFGIHRYVPGPTRYFTILRQPIERIISYYYFVQSEPEHYLYDYASTPGMTLLRYLEDQVSLQTDNFQTRQISGIWTDAGYGECDRAVLDRAKENLVRHFVVVGLTKWFDQTLLLLQRSFGWNNILYMRQNVTHRRPMREALPPKTLEVIAAHNQLDLELYAFGEAMFKQQIKDQGPSFAGAVKQFEIANRRIQPLLRAYWTARTFSAREWLRNLRG